MVRIRKQSLLAAEVGARIRALRERNGWQQKDLAERIGVQRPQLSRYEAGLEVPHPEKLITICSVFEVTTDEILRGRRPPDAIIADVELRERVRRIETLSRFYRNSAIEMLDAIIARAIQEGEAKGGGR